MKKNDFLKKLQKHTKSLEKYKNDIDVDNIKKTIIDGQQFLEDDNCSQDLVRELISLSEKNINAQEALFFVRVISSFWMNLLSSSRKIIVFFGETVNFDIFNIALNKNYNYEILYSNVDLGIGNCLQTLEAAGLGDDDIVILCYDDKGSFILKHKHEVPDCIIFLYYDVPFISKANYNSKKYAMYLEHEYQKIRNNFIENVVTGSSYGWHSIPSSLTTTTSNMALYSCDISYSHAIIKNITEIKNIKTHIHVTSMFDLYYELSKSKYLFNQKIYSEVSSFSDKNGIKYGNFIDKSNNVEFVQEEPSEPILDSLDNVLFSIMYSKGYSVNTNDEFLINESLVDLSLFDEQNKINHMSKEKWDLDASERGCSHSKLYKNKDSFVINSDKITEMVNNAEKMEYRMYIVFTPQPVKYLSCINQSMIKETNDFYKQILCGREYLKIIDMSHDDEFSHTDFLDGDHLNYNGAVKFVSKLKKLGITI